MVVLTILAMLAIILYLSLGYFFGRWCHRKYYSQNSLPAWAEFMLWPFSGYLDGAEDIFEFETPIVRFKEKDYTILMTLFWPLKILWNIGSITVYILLHAVMWLVIK